jgi:cellulose synthase (UDP-forming)
VRTIYTIGAITWLATLWGFSGIVAIDPIYKFVVAPLLFLITLYHLVSYGIILFYKKPSLGGHMFNKELFERKVKPSVDIFLPICGEPLNILERTWDAVRKIDYPYLHVYVLDDTKDLLVSQVNRMVATNKGFGYIRRPNVGECKKAGNLKYAYERTNGDFIVILDADFAPHKDFLRETLPYFQDDKTAIVQTPQYFETHSQLEHGAAYVQEDFYRFIQVARDRLGAPLCCGSNAVYRRTALDSIGGTAQVEHSEDAITGFKLTAKGWKVKYIPVILATGLCPDDLHAYVHQQHRWASGSLMLMKSKEFWTSSLSIKQKLCYISGFMYYLSHPIALVFSFQIFLALFFYSDSISWINAIPFYPYIIWSMVTLPAFRLMKVRFGNYLVSTIQLFTFTHAVFAAIWKKATPWITTGAKTTSVSRTFQEVTGYAKWYVIIQVSLILIAVLFGLIHPLTLRYYSIQFWIIWNIVLVGTLLYQLKKYKHL